MEKVEKIKYPRYSREEKISSIFSDEDVKEIVESRLQGLTYRALAKLYGISPDSAWFIVNKIIAPEKLEKRRARGLRCYHKRDKEIIRKNAINYAKDKRKRKHRDLNNYYKNLMRKFRNKKPTMST